ncbi:hypothetical protein D3C79_680460 [compost metagenome]
MDLGVFQVVRLAVTVHILHIHLQARQAIGAAVDIDLRGDGETDVLIRRLGVATHGIGIDQSHMQAEIVAGIVLRQGKGQLVEITQTTRQLDQILAVDEVIGEPLYAHTRRQAGEDDTELVRADIRGSQGDHALELMAEIDAVILHPDDGLAVVQINCGCHLTRMGSAVKLGAGLQLPICRLAYIIFIVITQIDDLGVHFELGGANIAIWRAQRIGAQGIVRHGPVTVTVVDPPHHHEAGRQIADDQIVDDLLTTGVQILECEDPPQRNIVPIWANQIPARLYQIAIGLHHGLDIQVQVAVNDLVDDDAGVHVMLGHGDVTLDMGVPVAVFRCLHQQLAAALQAI